MVCMDVNYQKCAFIDISKIDTSASFVNNVINTMREFIDE